MRRVLFVVATHDDLTPWHMMLTVRAALDSPSSSLSDEQRSALAEVARAVHRSADLLLGRGGGAPGKEPATGAWALDVMGLLSWPPSPPGTAA